MQRTNQPASIVVILFIITLFIFTSCQSAGLLFNREGKFECGGDGKAITLENNPQAVNPSYNELIAFIKADTTDSNAYIERGENGYVCADFAEDVHNNAEAAGIRAGWVGISFFTIDEGHAINVFETVDTGLVYIDCTNTSSPSADNDITESDAIAYIEIGRKYGIIPLDYAISLDYEFYTDYEQKWLEYKFALKLYNDEVARYNSEVKDKVYTIGTLEERMISAWKASLTEQELKLADISEELGESWYKSEFADSLVKDVLIHW